MTAISHLPDFHAIFRALPGLYLLLNLKFEIIEVSDTYLHATMVKREAILGCNVFDAFPDNPNDLEATGVKNLLLSLSRVLQNKITDTMAVQKYDIRRPASEGGEFEVRYWSPINAPIFDAGGQLQYILHRVEDVTDFIQLKKNRSHTKKSGGRFA